MRSTTCRNLYRIDDILMRAGGVAALLFVAAFVAILTTALANADPSIPRDRDPGLAALLHNGPLLALLALCPAVLLTAGISLRRRERRILAIWKLLEQNAEISVPGLIANSDFERRDLEHAVRFLNNRGLDHYVWNRESDTIQHARLQTTSLHVEKCDACGAGVALDVPLSFHEIPRCPHCDDPVSADELEERRAEALEQLRAERQPVSQPDKSLMATSGDFSLVVFLILLAAFWPAAVVYAWHKQANASRTP